ncbi:hypothetical protein Q9233_002861 [Columba guinea]|nr:hypothetical protein Q9233_002861 [Columba guinea]
MRFALFLSWCCCLHGCALGTGFLYQFPASTLQHNYPEQNSGSPGSGFASRRLINTLNTQAERVLQGLVFIELGLMWLILGVSELGRQKTTCFIYSMQHSLVFRMTWYISRAVIGEKCFAPGVQVKIPLGLNSLQQSLIIHFVWENSRLLLATEYLKCTKHCTYCPLGKAYAIGRHWCHYTVTRTVSCQVQNGSETVIQRVYQSCRWPGPCANLVSYRTLIRPTYKMSYRTVTTLEWRCCPGFTGSNCEEATVWKQGAESVYHMQPHVLHLVTKDGVDFGDRDLQHCVFPLLHASGALRSGWDFPNRTVFRKKMLTLWGLLFVVAGGEGVARNRTGKSVMVLFSCAHGIRQRHPAERRALCRCNTMKGKLCTGVLQRMQLCAFQMDLS